MPLKLTLLFLLLLLAATSAVAECIPIEQAFENIGRDTCVSGQVLKVAQTQSGTWLLDFCANFRECPFTIVVFPRDLRDVGDVQQLEGKTVEIHGKIQAYGKRAEIILRDARQLKGDFAKLPPMPKQYDAARHGSFSAGDKKTHAKRTSTN